MADRARRGHDRRRQSAPASGGRRRVLRNAVCGGHLRDRIEPRTERVASRFLLGVHQRTGDDPAARFPAPPDPCRRTARAVLHGGRRPRIAGAVERGVRGRCRNTRGARGRIAVRPRRTRRLLRPHARRIRAVRRARMVPVEVAGPALSGTPDERSVAHAGCDVAPFRGRAVDHLRLRRMDLGLHGRRGIRGLQGGLQDRLRFDRRRARGRTRAARCSCCGCSLWARRASGCSMPSRSDGCAPAASP